MEEEEEREREEERGIWGTEWTRDEERGREREGEVVRERG
jgi:hypothetical protein